MGLHDAPKGPIQAGHDDPQIGASASASTPSASPNPSASDPIAQSTATQSTDFTSHPPPAAPLATPHDRQRPEANFAPGLQRGDFGDSVSRKAAEADKQPLPFLATALGVLKKPSTVPLTREEKRERFVDQDRRMAKRRAIVKEATRGYFNDFHATRSHGGKTWRAPGTMIRHDRSLYFPSISGTCLADRSTKSTTDMLQGKVSIVSLISSTISEQHTKSFNSETLQVYDNHPSFQLVQVNLQENALKMYLVSLFLSNLRRQTPASQHGSYILSRQNMELDRDAMGLHNKHVGYTYLVGPDLKIRWAGCGFAEEEESRALLNCTAVLLRRAEEAEKEKASA
ncbi:hypothetical protein IE81DRAFT_294858 [Ceraceosorus guamensis]|uniref:Uncharacterized protein n=1 Tax=Ceraceosorus guamensis TaxID=1522189 RepID=A0A316VQA8_9BASI|nr:hypothetical protein IE81DRAFT_294858 [Ceraceosorus guamensis]PWN39434.1 hypothetical protein IE81DRAFT_294858 [Ceraceosorus guamensis]